MLTWLDYYVQGASESARAAGLGDFDGDDVAAMAILSALNLKHITAVVDRQCIDSDESVTATLASCVHALTAHAVPEGIAHIRQIYGDDDFTRKLYATQALRPSRKLLETLRGARAPATDDWKTPLLAATWYFDMPDGALKISPSLQLRAVFTQPTRWEQIVIVCILTVPGSNKIAGRFAWVWGQDSPVYGIRLTGVDPKTVRDQIEQLLQLLVLYAQVAEKAEFIPLPHISARELTSLKPKKRKARLRKASLFSIRELKPPKDRFGRRPLESQEPGWRLDRAIEVRGHFKWQPHGPKQSKRKLIWIDAYVRGPKDKLTKPILEILPADPNDPNN